MREDWQGIFPASNLTCAFARKQTERCHSGETCSLTVGEYARVQIFIDELGFAGLISSQYKQIGNAVSVNVSLAIGRSLISLMNSVELNQKNYKLIQGLGHKFFPPARRGRKSVFAVFQGSL